MSICIAQLDLILKALKLCFMLNGITQFYLPSIRFILARGTQLDLEHYICNELLSVLILPTSEGSLSQVICLGMESNL